MDLILRPGLSSVAAIGAAPNANGASVAGTVLTLQPASASFGGLITAGTQTVAGAKTFLSLILSQPAGTAGISLDPNAATGAFALALSPANLTAARRWSFPDRSDTVAGLGAQTFTGAQTFASTLSLSSSVAGTYGTTVTNTSAAAGAGASYTAANDAAAAVTFGINGSGYGTYGIFSGSSAIVYASNAAGISIMADNATGVIKFATGGNSEKMKIAATGDVSISSSTASTSTTTGALVVTGGIGCGGRVTVDGATTKTLKYANGVANAAVAVLFGAIGPTGSTAGNAQGWIRIDVAGTDRYIPYW